MTSQVIEGHFFVAISPESPLQKGELIGLAAMAMGLGILIIKSVISSTSHKNFVHPYKILAFFFLALSFMNQLC